MLKQVSNILLYLYSLRQIVILNLEIVEGVVRFLNVIIVCRKILVDWYVGAIPTLLGTCYLRVDSHLDCAEGSLCIPFYTMAYVGQDWGNHSGLEISNFSNVKEAITEY